MLEIRYSEPKELDISGTVDELQFVRQKIFELVQSETSQIAIDADGSVNTAPYNLAFPKLIILKNSSPTKVSLKNRGEIYIEGSPYCLEALASFLDFDLNSRSGAHSHYEYYDGNEWISPESIPLVISVK